MNDYTAQNKKAWEHRAYEFWYSQKTPQEWAAYLATDPKARLHGHHKYFDQIKGKKLANPCGSNGRTATALAMLGAEVTIFDISEENKRFALELAEAANVPLRYVVGDFYDLPLEQYGDSFDIAYLEGGILHYFHDLNRFTRLLFEILKPGGELILSDFHPYRKILPVGATGKSAAATAGNYFDDQIHHGDVAYKGFFTEGEQQVFPDCLLRFYTLSEIINAVIGAGFTVKEFLETPHWENKKVPGDFVIYAVKNVLQAPCTAKA